MFVPETDCWRQTAGDRLLETDCWRQTAGDRLLETDCWIQTAGDRLLETDRKDWRSICRDKRLVKKKVRFKPEDTRESTYDVVATMTYKAQSTEIPPACIQGCIEAVERSFSDLGEMLTNRRSAGGFNILVNFKPTVVGEARGNSIPLIYTMMVDPSISQPKIFDICGQTHNLIFDLVIGQTNKVIQPIIKIISPDIQCPTLTAAQSGVFCGFACTIGEVLNKIESSLVPRGLECPAGYTAGRNASPCTLCPRFQYQDEARQGSCNACPAGR